MVKVENLKVSYNSNSVIKNFSTNFEKGKIITIIGPNGSGKSTALKAIAKLMKKDSGKIVFANMDIDNYSNKELSKKLAVLMQTNTVPTSFTVKQLVSYGRIPHKKFFEMFDIENKKHEDIINWSMEKTGVKNMQDKLVSSLSGGERQRVWIATALAQQPEVLFLDEPTTYLDISHQLEVMELVKKLNKEQNITVVMVLHDLNQATKYSDKLIVMKNGDIVSYGTPKEVITEELLKDVYNIYAHVSYNKYTDSICVDPLKLNYSLEV